MLQTPRQAVRLLQRPYRHQLRCFAAIRPTCPTASQGNDPHTGSEPPEIKHDRQHSPHPTSEHEPIGRSLYVVLAVIFGSLAFYKFSRTNSSDPATAGDVSKQPLITRLLHRFDYFGEQNTIRNDLFTNMIQQAGHDKSLFDGAPTSAHVHLQSPEVFFNSGAPWNVPAGSSANLDHLREHYHQQNIEEEQKRKDRLEWRARNAAEKAESGKVKEAFGETINAVSQVGNKAAKGQ